MKLIIGLGNPGSEYENNRHNLGFMCLNYLAKKHDIRFNRKEGKARVGNGELAGTKVLLAKPQTYMNNSGDAVSRLVAKFGVHLEDLIVIHDDLDLPLGKIRISQGSGPGGHKGIESIIFYLDSKDFIRIRIGIGRPQTSETCETEVISYVLSDFTPEEKEIIDKTIPRVTKATICLLSEGLTVAMNKYN